ncbi:MAG: hypothetical protein IJT50_06150 [Lentisphaeria bacterium]|nr:hypothetical protein [Lentisphaeria bacterium]
MLMISLSVECGLQGGTFFIIYSPLAVFASAETRKNLFPAQKIPRIGGFFDYGAFFSGSALEKRTEREYIMPTPQKHKEKKKNGCES